MLYDISGNTINSGYSKNGQSIAAAYNKDGVIIFPGDPSIIKVMSYNCGSWYDGKGTNVPADKDEFYYALQNGMLLNDDPDILCIEEYRAQFSQAGRTASSMLSQYFPYIQEQNGTDQYFGRAICSKYPISNYATHLYSGESKRYYDSCQINIGGKDITIVVTHLDVNSRDKRAAQTQELITFLSNKQRFILCGDFNTIDSFNESGADYIAVVKPMLDEGFNAANCSTYGFLRTYSDAPTDGTWTGCLDNIFTSSNIAIQSAVVDETKLTSNLTERIDHMPIIADVEL